MKLLVFLAKGFETIEFSGFIDVMGWAKTDFGCDVEVVRRPLFLWFPQETQDNGRYPSD